MRLIILGPPGSGKGTQAERLSQRYNIPRVSTGDILRDEVKEGTKIGHKVKAFMERGELVPDDLIISIIQNRLMGHGFVLDGFPRNLYQAKVLNLILKDTGATLDRVINLGVREAILIERLTKRRVCKGCGLLYHLEFRPPKVNGICDECKGPLYTRKDDEEETIKNRLEVYRSNTKPLIDYYKRKGLLLEVNGELDPDGVFGEILASIDGKG